VIFLDINLLLFLNQSLTLKENTGLLQFLILKDTCLITCTYNKAKYITGALVEFHWIILGAMVIAIFYLLGVDLSHLMLILVLIISYVIAKYLPMLLSVMELITKSFSIIIKLIEDSMKFGESLLSMLDLDIWYGIIILDISYFLHQIIYHSYIHAYYHFILSNYYHIIIIVI
jgi:hypothetical protein